MNKHTVKELDNTLANSSNVTSHVRGEWPPSASGCNMLKRTQHHSRKSQSGSCNPESEHEATSDQIQREKYSFFFKGGGEGYILQKCQCPKRQRQAGSGIILDGKGTKGTRQLNAVWDSRPDGVLAGIMGRSEGGAIKDIIKSVNKTGILLAG